MRWPALISRVAPAEFWTDRAGLSLAGGSASIDLASAMVLTTTSLFLATEVRAGALMIGLFFAGQGAVEVVAELCVGVVSDRLRSRRNLLAVCSALSGIGALCYLGLRDYYAVLAAGAIFFGIGAATFGQTFAYIRELAEARGSSAAMLTSILRSLTSVMWAVGPPVGFYLLSHDGFNVLYAVAAVLYMTGAVMFRTCMPNVAKPARKEIGEKRSGLPLAKLPGRVYLVLGATAILVTLNMMYQIDIALFVTKHLHLGIGIPGLLVGLAAAIEVPAMLIFGALADRVGAARLVLGAAMGAVLFFALLPLATSVPELLAMQVLNAAWTCTALGIPVVIMQNELPEQPGVASSLFGTAFKVGLLLGGTITGVSAELLGFAHVFWVCAGGAVIAVLLMSIFCAVRGKPLCTVIVPTYNRAGLLRHTLDSLVRQKMAQGGFEVIVVDDGSSDGTAGVVDEYRSRLDLSYYYQEDEGYRAAAARNVGIGHARAGICVFVDSGVILHSGCLAAYVDRHRRSAEPIAVCGYVYCFNQDEDGAEISATVDFADPDAAMASLKAQGKWPDIREWFYAKYGDDFSGLPAPWLIYWTCSVSAETSQLKAVGMFDEQYRSWGAEDVDLAYRLHRHGVRFVLDRQACALHMPHAKDFEDHTRSAADNCRYFAEKYDTPITRLLIGNDPFIINDIIIERNLPDCAEYEVTRRIGGRSAARSAERQDAASA